MFKKKVYKITFVTFKCNIGMIGLIFFNELKISIPLLCTQFYRVILIFFVQCRFFVIDKGTQKTTSKKDVLHISH